MDPRGEVAAAELTKEFVFGLNVVTVAGFLVMGAGLSLGRQGRVRARLAFALMGAGTALTFLGIYLATPAAP